MEKIIVNGDGAIVGRLGSFTAKELLKGNQVFILNSEKAIISGNKKNIIQKIQRLRRAGGSSQKGPKISRLPDRLLKRMIRGMLPWKKTRGRMAFKRLRCYVGNGNLKEDELKNVRKLEQKKLSKYLTIKQISELI